MNGALNVTHIEPYSYCDLYLNSTRNCYHFEGAVFPAVPRPSKPFSAAQPEVQLLRPKGALASRASVRQCFGATGLYPA